MHVVEESFGPRQTHGYRPSFSGSVRLRTGIPTIGAVAGLYPLRRAFPLHLP